MDNFLYHNPTKVLFGKNEEQNIGTVIRSYGFRKVLLHYGGGSVIKRGLYAAVTKPLANAGIAYVELGGVEANPKLPLVQQGIIPHTSQNGF